jgi:hypothetical protein
MEQVLNGPKTENAAELCPAWLDDEIKEAQRLVEKSVKDFKAAGSAALEDTAFAAKRLYKRSQFAIEDSVDEVAHTIRRHPVGAAAAIFAIGVALGFLLPRLKKADT